MKMQNIFSRLVVPIILIFPQMVSAQMPELMQEKDIFYLRDKFFLSDTEKGAVARLRKEIDKSLKTNDPVSL